jgi:hypothetical protein
LLTKWKPEKLVILIQKAWKANDLDWKAFFEQSKSLIIKAESVKTLQILRVLIDQIIRMGKFSSGYYQSEAKATLEGMEQFRIGESFRKAEKVSYEGKASRRRTLEF